VDNPPGARGHLALQPQQHEFHGEVLIADLDGPGSRPYATKPAIIEARGGDLRDRDAEQELLQIGQAFDAIEASTSSARAMPRERYSGSTYMLTM